MFCRKCGTALPDDSVFCNKCGATVEKIKKEQALSDEYYDNDMYDAGRKYGIAALVCGIIAVIFALVLTTTVFAVINNDERPHSSYTEERGEFDEEQDNDASMMLAMIVVAATIATPILAAKAMNRGYKNGISITGLVIGIVAISLDLFTFLMISVKMG